MAQSGEITVLLERIRAGEQPAVSQLWTLVDREVRDLAARKLRREAPGSTLQTTALANEVYLRLFGGKSASLENRRHFWGAVARSMRQILMNHARKRRPRDPSVELNELPDGEHGERGPARIPGVGAEELERCLETLQADRRHQRKCMVLQLRCFAGRSVEETAELVGISTPTVKRDMKLALTWLNHELTRGRAG